MEIEYEVHTYRRHPSEPERFFFSYVIIYTRTETMCVVLTWSFINTTLFLESVFSHA